MQKRKLSDKLLVVLGKESLFMTLAGDAEEIDVAFIVGEAEDDEGQYYKIYPTRDREFIDEMVFGIKVTRTLN